MSNKPSRKNVRLSKGVAPVRYDIELKPDLENFTFSGREIITIQVAKSTRAITLHAKELEVDTASILAGKDSSRATPRGKIFAERISYDEKSETATFAFEKPVPAGRQKLELFFKGTLNDKMRGFYRSKYLIDGKEHYMATTQFEATDARRAFPSFDEPAHKAVFDISLIVPRGKTAISNTLPVSRLEHESGLPAQAGCEIVKFSPTPRMSTYLAAFIVGDFEHIEAKTKSGVLVRVFTTPGKKEQGRFALDCARKVLEFYEKYFDIPYPLPVLDMIAIPDFSSGAMENWGAVTYRESALLVDPEKSSVSNKQWVALVVAHELAHQWFGNLVTMEWWTHLWLNEGFASYIEYLATDTLFPAWDIWTQFCTADLGVALRLDALRNTHPIEVEVHHPDEIGEIFDEVSYSKGASVIRMLAEYLGERHFRDGLRHYLKKHSYKNTETGHLWQAFEKVSGKPVRRMMKNWTGKPGYPVVTVGMKGGKPVFSQKRFFASPLSARKINDKTKWEIPIAFREGKVNPGETAFFRTAYPRDMLAKLRKPVEDKKLSARDRLGLIRDLFALSEAGVVPTTDALEFLSAYKNEDNYTVWVEIATGIGRLEQILAREKSKADLDRLAVSLFSPLYAKLGWKKSPRDGHTDALLRSLVLARLGRSGHPGVIAEARKYFTAIRAGRPVHADIRGAVYAVVAAHGGTREYADMMRLYKKETLHEEGNRIGAALGDFADPKLLRQTAEFAVSAHVRMQDGWGILSSVGGNQLGRDIWLAFITKHWKLLVSRYGDGGMTLSRLVKAIGASAEEKHLAIFKKFFRSHQAPGAARAVLQVLERLESNIAWRRRDAGRIAAFLRRPASF